ncbi:hypothetical protein Tco_0313006 [Tanacetum coccineum]
MGINQLTEDTFSSGLKDLIFVKSSTNNVSISDSIKPRLSEAENSTLSNHDTGKIPSVESQRNTTDPSVAVTESSMTNYDSADESSVCSTPLPPLKKLDGVEPVSGPKTIKSILMSKSTFKTETLKGIIINEPSLEPARGNKSSSASKTNSALAGKLKNIKMEDDPPLAIVMKELNELKLQISKNKSSYFRNINTQQYPKRLGFALKGYSDSDCVGCNVDRKSTSGACQLLEGKRVCCSANKQQSVAMFSAKAEDVAAAGCCANILWIKSMIDNTLFIYKTQTNVILVQIHVYDIILRSTSTKIEQSKIGILINKERYVKDLLRKHDKIGSSVNTSIVPHNMLGPDLNGKATSSKHKESHLISVKRIFSANKQQSVAMFSAEAEDIAAAGCCANILWIKSQLTDYDIIYEEVSFSIPTGGIYGEVGVNTFRNAIGAHYLPHSREYVAPPSINIVRPWFETIGYREPVPIKGTLKKSLLPPRWRLLMAQIIQCLGGKTGGFDQITNKDAIILYSLANGINIDYAIIFWEAIIIKLKRDIGKSATEPVVFKALNPSFNAERVSQGIKPGAKSGHKKHSTFSKQPSVSSKEATKGGSSKASTSSKIGHSKKRKESSSAMDSNPSQPSVSTLVDTGTHKEDHQATDGPTSLGVTSEARANPQLSSGMSAFNLNEPIYSASFIIHSESTSRNDASVVSTAKANLGKSTPSDFVPQQQVNGWKLSSLNPQQEKGPAPLLDSDSDDETHMIDFTVETSRIKKLKKFDFITENGKHILLTEEQINQQKKIEEEAKAEAAKQEGKVEKAELVDLLGAEVVNKYYNDKLQYDRYCDKMLNRRAESRITNCDVLTKKGPITLKVYREDGTSEVIPNFKALVNEEK